MSEMLGGLPEGARGGEAQEGARGCGVEVVLVILPSVFFVFVTCHGISLYVMLYQCNINVN